VVIVANNNEQIRAFVMTGEGDRIGEPGNAIFRDWDSGARVNGYEGSYVRFGIGDSWVMRTWIDSSSGERAVVAVRPWGGWRENVDRT
jgi:hypothetical protein